MSFATTVHVLGPVYSAQQILDGKQPEYPLHRRDATFKQAPKARTRSENLTLPLS